MHVLRRTIFWAHLITGVFVAVVVLIMSVTGVLLTYQRQITAWADTRGMQAGPPAAGAERLPVETLLERVRAAEPGEPSSIRWLSDPERPVEISYGRGQSLFVNGYTGEVLGRGNETVRGFFSAMVSWHRWLGAEGENRDLARAITGASNLGFLFLVLSGLYLWWPRRWNWRAFRNVLVFRRGLSPKARDFNWHHVIGFWSAIPLAIVVASAVVISYPWASDLVYQLAGEEPPAGGGRRGGRDGAGGGELDPAVFAGIDPLLARAVAEVPGWRSVTLQLAGDREGPVSFSIDRGDGGQPQLRGEVTLDRATGAVVGLRTFDDETPGRRMRSILRFAHTGEVAGLLGQTIAGLVSAGAVVLVWTGLALTWRRFGAWRRRAPRPVPAARARRPRELSGVG